MTSIIYYPPLSTEQELIDVVSRAAWFLSHTELHHIYIPLSDEHLASLEWKVAPGMDPAIQSKFAWLRTRVRFVTAAQRSEISNAFTESDIVLIWAANAPYVYVDKPTLDSWLTGKKVWKVDPHNTRYEGSFYIEVGLHLSRNRDALISTNRERFHHVGRQLGHFRRGYIIATGPSASQYSEHNFDNALTVVCNSVILDNALMQQTSPQFLVFADPIFHFGPSQYAAEFRSALAACATQYNFTICVPFKYYGILVSSVPQLSERIIGVPFTKDIPFNFDLLKAFQVKTTANILTLLMTPLAATFAEELCYLGCDGRPVKDDSYFWNHNPSTQINDKMRNIREVHPAFFAIDYNEYYSEHCNTLELQLSEAEKAGKSIRCLAFSHIPALSGRQIKHPVSDSSTRLSSEYSANDVLHKKLPIPEISVIMPLLNAEPHLQQAIDSVLAERSIPLELIIVDDGSTDDSLRTADSMAEKDPRVVVLRNGGVKGVSSARNIGIARARAPFVALLDADDFLYSGALKARYALINQIGADLVHSTTRMVSEDGRELLVNIGRNATYTFSDAYGAPAHLNSILARASKLRPFRFKEGMANGEDWLYLASLLRSGMKSFYVEGGGAAYRVHPRSAVNSSPIVHETRLLEVLDWLYSDASEDFVAKQYAGPLTEPSKHENVYSRRCSMLFTILFSSQVEQNTQFIRDAELVNFIAGKTLDFLVSRMRVPFARTFQIALEDSYSLTRQTVRTIHESLRHPAFQLYPAIFRSALSRALPADGHAVSAATDLAGTFTRSDSAHIDETKLVALYLQNSPYSGFMVDVGAHYGSSLLNFLDRDWKVLAFEPDESNRARLLERLARHRNRGFVTLDTRCVSNTSEGNVAFFKSNESTGISGLSAFRDTHIEAQRVDTVSLKDFFAGQEMPEVDFLKIDTEGHDLFVLQGFPWARNKPRVIECEFEDLKTKPLGYTTEDMADFLVSKGYTVYVSEWHPILRYGQQHDWHRLQKYPCELACKEAWGNLLAFSQTPDERLLADAIKSVMKIHGAAPPTRRTSLSSPEFEHWRQFGKNGPREWLLRHDPRAQQQLIIANFSGHKTLHRTYLGLVTLESDQRVTINLSVGRIGNKPYEGSGMTLDLAPGLKRTVPLSHKFKAEHGGVKIQVDVKQCVAKEAKIRIETCVLFTDGHDVLSAQNADQPAVSRANQLFRGEKYADCIPLYLAASRRLGSKVFEFNAHLALRRLGVTDKDLTTKILQELSEAPASVRSK